MKDLVARLKALSDPTRLKIMRLLLERELAVCELAAVLGISKPAVSQHLRRLKALGFIVERREGSTCFCTVDRTSLQEVETSFRRFFETPVSDLRELSDALRKLAELPNDENVCRCKGR